MPADSQAHPPRFRLWLRRQNVAEGPFFLRFEVMDGKGILRVARPGVLIDPPARQVGVEERLTPQQLRSTRFILVWDGGRGRQGHLLNRLEEPQLDRVELDRWHELEVLVDGGFRYVTLPVAAPAAETKPQKAKARRPSLSELRQALDSITVHTEDSEDVDSALASLTGPVPLAPQPRPIAEVAEAPLPGLAGALPAPVVAPRAPPFTTADYEVQRPVRRPTPVAEPSRGQVLADAPTVFVEGGPRDELLALGEADDSVEDAESLALGEADDSAEEAEALTLMSAPRGVVPVAPLSRAVTLAPEEAEEPVPAPEAPRGLGAAAFYASFSDSEEEAVFSIDLPTFRQSTEHVTVRSGAEDDHVVFAREELPPIRGIRPMMEEVPELLAFEESPPPTPAPTSPPVAAPPAPWPPPLRSRTNHDLEDAIVELPAPAAPRPQEPRSPAEAVRPPELRAARSVDDAEGVLHRSPVTLVRHLRRKVEEQRSRILELEARVIELEATLRRR